MLTARSRCAARVRADKLPDTAVEVTAGRGRERRSDQQLLTSGEALSARESDGCFFSFFANHQKHPRKQKLYVSVFDIGVAQRIQVLTP